MSNNNLGLIHSFVLFFAMLCASAMLYLLVVTPFSLNVQLVFSCLVLGAAYYVRKKSGVLSNLVLILLAVTISSRYILWRYTDTLEFQDPYSQFVGLALFGAEIYAFVVMIIGHVQSVWPLNRKPCPLPSDTSLWPSVDVFIPTYNEPLHVVKTSILAAMNLDWPSNKFSIYLLDDGNREEFRIYARQAGIKYISRTDNTHAKAGNLNNAMESSHGDLIAVFDCDHVPTRSFLQLTAGWFLKDKKLASLQTPHHFYSPDPFEKNLSIHNKIPNEGVLFYGLIQNGNDLWNATFFCGSCALLRRSSLNEIGGIAVETVTEDAHTAIRLHRAGFTSAYISIAQAAGLATESLAAHINQRIRWARGLAQIFRIDNPLLGKGLSLAQRICYTNATIHFLYAIPRLIFLTAPLAFLFFDLYIIQAEALVVAAMAVPHILHNHIAISSVHGKFRHSFWAEVYETVLFVYILPPTIMALISPSKGKFNVTEKGSTSRDSFFDVKIATPFIILMLLNSAGVGVAVYRLFVLNSQDQGTVILNLIWTTYNLIMIGVALSVAWEVQQSRLKHRRKIQIPAAIRLKSSYLVDAITEDLSESGALVRLPMAIPQDVSMDKTTLLLSLNSSEFALPAEIVRIDGQLIRLRFVNLTIHQQKNLVALLYSNADRWMNIYKDLDKEPSRRSIMQLLKFSLFGIGRLIGFSVDQQRNVSSDSVLPKPVVYSSLLIVLIVLSYLFAGPSYAQIQNQQTVYEIPVLTDQFNKEQEIGLIRYGFTVPFSIRRDEVVEKIQLSLLLSYGGPEVVPSDVLTIDVNDVNVWKSEHSNFRKQRIEIDVDPRLLADFNLLKFNISRSNENQCANDNDKSYKVVLHDDSRIIMDATQLPFADNLANLPLPFLDARDPRAANIQIILPKNPDSSTLQASASVAGWLGSLASYRGVIFDANFGELAEQNSIVIGTVGQLSGVVDTSSIDGPILKILRNPNNPDYELLLVSGRNAKELHDAVNSLVHGAVDLLGSSVSGRRISLPPVRKYEATNWVATDRTTILQSLFEKNGISSTIENNNFAPIKLDFNLPADLFSWNEKYFPLHLKYHYKPMFGDFVEQLHVDLNGTEIASIDLEQSATSRANTGLSFLTNLFSNRDKIGTHRIDVPVELLSASNSFEFRFNAPAMIASSCNKEKLDNVFVSAGIDPGSWFDLSKYSNFGELPNLAYFANSGLPFTKFSDLENTAVVLPGEPTEPQVSLYLTVMGRIASITGVPPYNVKVIANSNIAGNVDNNFIVIGSINDQGLRETWLKNTMFNVSNYNLEPREPELKDWLKSIWETRNYINQLAEMKNSFRGASSSKSVIHGTESPFKDGNSVVLLLAEEEAGYSNLAKTVTDPTRFSLIQGGTVLIDGNTIKSFDPESKYSYGNVEWLKKVKWKFSQKPWIPFFGTIFFALIFAFYFSDKLKRKAHRRLNSYD